MNTWLYGMRDALAGKCARRSVVGYFVACSDTRECACPPEYCRSRPENCPQVLQLHLALAAVMSDAGLRRSEAAALRWGDMEARADGSGRGLIARPKTDKAGEGAQVALTPAAMRDLAAIRPQDADVDAFVFPGMRRVLAAKGYCKPVFRNQICRVDCPKDCPCRCHTQEPIALVLAALVVVGFLSLPVVVEVCRTP